MPPDSCQREKLDKVLKSLEVEAQFEDKLDAEFDERENEQAKDKGFKRGLYHYVDSNRSGIIWKNVLLFGSLQVMYFMGLYQILAYSKWTTWIFGWWVFTWSALGVTAGAHRLWAHKSFQALWPLRVFLMIGQSIAGQNTILTWSRDHRVHHKFSETDGDPHNSRRGFFFSHVGWLLTTQHPEYVAQAPVVYSQDLLKDPVVYFQQKHYKKLYLIFAIALPTIVPVYGWGETWVASFLIAFACRYVTCLHSTWFVNSAAHMFGDRPYNPNIQPRENKWVSFGAFGEGYHNYHHSFPWDYKTSEMGFKINLTKLFIDAMKYMGLAYNLKQVSPVMLAERRRLALISNSDVY